MKNQHLIPINIIDLVEKLNDPRTNENERNNYLQRLETVRDYCDIAVKKEIQRKNKNYSSSWKSTRDYCS